MVNLRAIAGEYDWQARHIQLAKLPVLLQNQKANNYKVYLDPGTYGTDTHTAFNHSFVKDPEIARWIGNVDFRRALSMAIDREELTRYSGLASARRAPSFRPTTIRTIRDRTTA